jgi:hypothetical protein
MRHAHHAVIRVDGGRGFIVIDPVSDYPVVVTAGHCLPKLPPSIATAYTHERTYEKLLGRLGGRRTVWTECMFVDPVSDVAVLGQPDNQELWEQADAYDKLTVCDEKVQPFVIGQVPESLRTTESPELQWSRAGLLSLDNEWFPCDVARIRCSLAIKNATKGIRDGMSGSPVVDDAGRAVGLVSVSGGSIRKLHTEAQKNPHLASALPGWMLKT